jgi:tetratricopeptide (TPR) repeat protein
MFGVFKTDPAVHGEIEYYNLKDWWLTEFSPEERKHIEAVYGSITSKKNFSSSQNGSGFLWVLSSWFCKYDDRRLNIKILSKAYDEAKKANSILDLHFTLGMMVENYYRLRDDEPSAFDNAVKACEEQINLAPLASAQFKRQYPHDSLPVHTGYEQLRIIYKKQGEYQKAIALCEQAKKQGWNGKWDKQIGSFCSSPRKGKIASKNFSRCLS